MKTQRLPLILLLAHLVNTHRELISFYFYSVTTLNNTPRLFFYGIRIKNFAPGR